MRTGFRSILFDGAAVEVGSVPIETVSGAAVLESSAVAVAASTAALTTQITLASSAASVATSTAALTTSIALTSSAAAVAASTAALTTQITPASNAASVASSTAALTTQITLAASPAAVATSTAALTTQIALDAIATASATSQAALTLAIALAASAIAAASASAELLVVAPVDSIAITDLTIVRSLLSAEGTIVVPEAATVTGYLYNTLTGTTTEQFNITYSGSSWSFARQMSASGAYYLRVVATTDELRLEDESDLFNVVSMAGVVTLIAP